MPYSVIYLDEFVTWLDQQEQGLQLRTLTQLELLKERGLLLNRPYVDTLKGSAIANLKELRLSFENAPIRICSPSIPNSKQSSFLLATNKAINAGMT